MRNLHSILGVSLFIALLTLLAEGLAIVLFLVVYQGDPKALPEKLITPFGTLVGIGWAVSLVGILTGLIIGADELFGMQLRRATLSGLGIVCNAVIGYYLFLVFILVFYAT